MYGGRLVGLAALLLSLAGCGPAEEASTDSPIPEWMDASLADTSCTGPRQCPVGYQCANYQFGDGSNTGVRCLDTRRLCAEEGCAPGSCMATRTAIPTVWCPAAQP